MATQEEVVYDWDTYAEEAKVPDFVLKTKEGTIKITNPTGVQIMRVSQGMRAADLELMLLGLTGDAYDDVTALLGQAGHQAFPRLVEDLMDHFGIYDEVTLRGPGGGTVKEKRPTKIKALLEMGYTVKGEARPSSA